MPGTARECKIRIIKDGPYIVSGNVPLSEKIIVSEGSQNIYKEGRPLPQAGTYSLCRCGMSKNPPFCDGSHEGCGFDGTETASRDRYSDRAVRLEGPGVDVLDDERCAYARFCHSNEGNIWQLIRKSDDPKRREEAVKAANDCPTGRFVALDKSGKPIEPVFEPSIEILQDPEAGASGPIFVKGNIPIESSDGYIYEIRNRAALCRCGKSSNKPFCDATHVTIKYTDYEKEPQSSSPIKEKGFKALVSKALNTIKHK